MVDGQQSSLAGTGLVVAAPGSGSGKTLITLGLLRALSRRGIDVQSAKAGPDYIDPQFHARASKNPCVNLDPWAMRPGYLRQLASVQAVRGPLLIEGMMGLYDGAMDGSGSVADLARLLNVPVLLVVDASHQSHSIAALVEGFANHRSDITVAGVVLNRVGSVRHEAMLKNALAAIDMPVLGAVRRLADLVMPERHLGLVQPGENAALEHFIERAADTIEQSVDITALCRVLASISHGSSTPVSGLHPLGQKIAVASDLAFAFSYPHLLDGWRQAGAEINLFSPLNNEGPAADADAIYLPGGYPELHAGKIASNGEFFDALLYHQQKGTVIYGECGGYMVLGEGLVDKNGTRHKMAGLLPLVTSFNQPKLHLGYRIAKPLADFPLINHGGMMSAHEFHYSRVENVEKGERLFSISDAVGENVATVGLRRNNVMGSYIHLIDKIED